MKRMKHMSTLLCMLGFAVILLLPFTAQAAAKKNIYVLKKCKTTTVINKQTSSFTVQYKYNKKGLAASKTDAVTTKYTYNSKNQLTKVDMNGVIGKYTYNKKGLIKNYTNSIFSSSRNKNNYIKYNKKNQIIETYGKYLVDDQIIKRTFTYNKSGKLSKITDSLSGTTTYSYDKKGNIKSVKDSNGTVTRKLTYKSGRVSKYMMKLPFGSVTKTYTYQKLNIDKNYVAKVQEQQWYLLNFETIPEELF